MNPRILMTLTALALALSGATVLAQGRTPPPSAAELEALYTTTIEDRTADILKAVNLTNEADATMVHDLIIAQYRVMRARDAMIDAQLRAMGKDINYKNRVSQLQAESKPLHDYFFAKLAEKLTPDQVEKVKDKLTYNKVKVTYDAYLAIVPGLTDADKSRILELLKAAREEAVDGGSAPEKSAIFQKYKDQINDYLNANGHDTAKAFKDWADAHPNTNNPAVK
ncbi:MAG: DUF3826 domain-containing protein [Verrucomicrobiae bacterium]|nr:DUF3826 domain-containing protein [Verrucomicrobiae bacterium]